MVFANVDEEHMKVMKDCINDYRSYAFVYETKDNRIVVAFSDLGDDDKFRDKVRKILLKKKKT